MQPAGVTSVKEVERMARPVGKELLDVQRLSVELDIRGCELTPRDGGRLLQRDRERRQGFRLRWQDEPVGGGTGIS
jgi:hypothetical protein